MAVRVAPGRWLRGALVAALVAAATVSLFDLTVSERVVDRAVSGEHHHAVQSALAVPEEFTRGEQRGGLVLAELLYAVGVALVVAGVAILGGPVRRPAHRWVALSAAGAWCLAALPALVLPPLPPGVEVAASIDARRLTYAAAVALGAAGCAAAAWAWRGAAGRRPAVRALAPVSAIVLSALIAVVVLPEDRLIGKVDSRLVHDFRVDSLVSQALFWVASAVGGAAALWRLRSD